MTPLLLGFILIGPLSGSLSAALCFISAAAAFLRGKRVVYGQEQH